MSALKKSGKVASLPDLSDFRKRYPLTVASFGSLANREGYLARIWEADACWQEMMERGPQAPSEVLVKGAPPAGLAVEAEFEIIYAGGVLGLLHAAVMAHRYKRRVMVFDTQEGLGRTERDWNISDEELGELERAGLFNRDELEAAIINRYRSGFVKFHDAASRVKTPPLWMSGVFDIALDANRLLALAAQKIRTSETGSELMEGSRFVRCYAQTDRVLVEVEEARTRRRRLLSARLFIDAMGTDSTVARQLNEGRASVTHVCPTVGTIARGFVRGEGPERVDFNVGEILVSNEDAHDHRQLIWEGFAGRPQRDEYTTYLFFYDAVDSPADKSLLALFERYFEKLPRYKRTGAQWRVIRPVFGYAPGFQHHGWMNRRRAADNRVMLIGEAAGISSPLAFSGLGPHVRHLKKWTHMVDLGLEADLLDANALNEICVAELGLAQVASLAELLRPTPTSAAPAVNETLNAVMAALHNLDERVRRELFQDRLSLSALRNLLSHTVRLYPRILQRLREHLGARGTLWWLANIAEAAFSERRAAPTSTSLSDAEQEEEPAQKFARYLRHYKNRQGADKQG
jgi:lycopene cyclase CruA